MSFDFPRMATNAHNYKDSHSACEMDNAQAVTTAVAYGASERPMRLRGKTAEQLCASSPFVVSENL